MGRITIFTGNDSNSKYALRELERRHLPYTEISVTSFPDRLHDLEALSDAPSVPQVFFNTRYVGGVDSLKKELRRWDRSKRYATPYEKYEAEIQCGFDPSNPRLAIPQGEPEVFSHARLSVLSPTTIQLPDGTMTSFRDITEKLRNSLPTVELRQKGVLHKHVFSGNMASQVFERIFEITHGEALTFGTTLMETGVIQPLKGKGKGMSEAAHYRLQCFHQPSVLNSYCHWRGQQATNNHSKLVVDLIRLLNDIDGSAINDRGLSDYSKALKNDLLPLFEESVCELQQVRLDEMQNKEKLAFAINVYCLLMRYAFYKVGIPLSESDRLHFLTNVKFNIGGTLYSFEDWSNALFGRQKKIKSHSMKVEGADARVHLAMNNGTMAGSTQSLPFTSFDADNIDQQLTVAAKVFMGDDRNFAINRRKGSVEMSNLFKYERNDFHGSTENHLIEGTLDYMTGKDKSDARGLLASNLLPKIKYTAPVLGRKTKNALWYEREALEVDQKGLRGMLNRFRPPKMHANERARLEALRSLNVLDTVEEERYDRITNMVRTTFNVPLVFVSLVDQNRQWFKSVQWHTLACPRVNETGREVSFCGHAIQNSPGEIFVIPNALKDDRFADNPLVTGDLGIRFYAGVPLDVPSPDDDGTTVNIGTLCMIDQKPRDLNEKDFAKFREFGKMIKKEILRRDHELNGSGFNTDSSTSSFVSSNDSDDIESDCFEESF